MKEDDLVTTATTTLPCPLCGSTDTYADAIAVPTYGDRPPWPTIPGELHCRACGDGRYVRCSSCGAKHARDEFHRGTEECWASMAAAANLFR